MDGVLIDARDWHYQALNESLEIFGFSIPRAIHEDLFDGLPTKTKLARLSDEFGLPRKLHALINEIKQEKTLRIAASNCFPIPHHLILMTLLKSNNFKIGLATNSIRQTTEAMLKYAGLFDFFDSIITSEDVTNPKPHPEIYLMSLDQLNSDPKKTLVVEDNKNGIKSATSAGCIVCEVADPTDVHVDKLLKYLKLEIF